MYTNTGLLFASDAIPQMQAVRGLPSKERHQLERSAFSRIEILFSLLSTHSCSFVHRSCCSSCFRFSSSSCLLISFNCSMISASSSGSRSGLATAEESIKGMSAFCLSVNNMTRSGFTTTDARAESGFSTTLQVKGLLLILYLSCEKEQVILEESLMSRLCDKCEA